MRERKKPFSILNLIIILLSVVLAVSILITIFLFREAGSVYYDRESTLFHYLNDGEYYRLAQHYYENGIGREEDKKVGEVADYYAVGRYFEKAFLANAYKTAGQEEKASRLLQQMEAAGEDMGQFSGEKEKILKLFPSLLND